MKMTYYGHSCFSMEVKGKVLLFDPFISGNPLAKEIDINQIKADYIFVSHGHSDHIDDCVEIAKNTGAMVIAAFEITAWLSKKGVKHCHPMNIGGKKIFDFGTVKCVNAIHSSQLPDGSYGGNPLGFVVTSAERNFYYSGDTALTLDMQLIADMAKMDLALLPIGDNFTMDAEDAAKAAQMVKATKVAGLHYNSFEIIRIDKEEAKKVFQSKGIELLLPDIGSSLTI